MTTVEHDVLRAQLVGVDEIVAKLTSAEADLLAGLIQRKRVADRRSLDSSLDEALSILPRLVRVPARKILFGK